jgi:hypothetical protein
MANAADRLVPTQMRQFNDSLHSLKEQEQTALAELHAEDPERLISRFDHSVQTVARYPVMAEPFHGARSEAWMEKVREPVTSTTTFVAELAAAGNHQVVDFSELDFDFVDREVFPLRSTSIPIDGRGARRSVDLLLRASNGLPIVGELKVAGDSPPYPALIQALMYSTEFSSESQLERLADHYDFIIPADQPVISIYLIAHEAPERGTYRRRSFEATKVIVEKLMADCRVAYVIRHFAYLESSIDGAGRMVFKHLF